MVHPSSSIPWSAGGCASTWARRTFMPRLCCSKVLRRKRILGMRGSSKDGDPGFLLFPGLPVLCQTDPPHFARWGRNLPQSSSNPLWEKSEQSPAPEDDAITEKKKRTLSPSFVIGAKWFEQFCSTNQGNVSFPNSSDCLGASRAQPGPGSLTQTLKQKRGGEGTSLCPTGLHRS